MGNKDQSGTVGVRGEEIVENAIQGPSITVFIAATEKSSHTVMIRTASK